MFPNGVSLKTKVSKSRTVSRKSRYVSRYVCSLVRYVCLICFTICLFISPDLDGPRAPKMKYCPRRDPQKVSQPKYEATAFCERLCFTICLFISPDLDEYRAPRGINPTRPRKGLSLRSGPGCIRFLTATHNLSNNHGGASLRRRSHQTNHAKKVGQVPQPVSHLGSSPCESSVLVPAEHWKQSCSAP